MGDRVSDVSSYGESETFQILQATSSSNISDGGDEEDDEGSFPLAIVIAAVAGALPPPTTLTKLRFTSFISFPLEHVDR